MRPLFACSLPAVLAAACVLAGCAEPAPPPDEAVAPAPAAPLSAEPGAAVEPWPEGAVVGEVVYVPAYSHIYHRDASRTFALAATLSVRNTDPERPLTVTAVAYHDSAGRLVREPLDRPLTLAPLATRSFVVEEQDRTGGDGASFLVTWSASAAVSAPVVEAVMISTAQSQGLSFVSAGRVVRRLGPPEGAPR